MATDSKKLTSTKKLSLLMTVVHKEKADYFLDLIESNNVNLQITLIGNGTTKSQIFTDEVGTKAVILSIVSDDNLDKILKVLEEKFLSLREGKGVSWAIPLSSVMGVTFFNFLSNNRESVI
ncbi:MAG: hypothetical protein J6P02_04775 [Lachnospiraceae bacterium]|nr:hypothetical protein [Lachnospiraceae bacterium]